MKRFLLAAIAALSLSAAHAGTAPAAKDLVHDYGARCDGVTDDSFAMQKWLNDRKPGTTNFALTIPAGVCTFSSTLSMQAYNNYSIKGAGVGASVLKYIGAPTTADKIALSGTLSNLTLQGFSVVDGSGSPEGLTLTVAGASYTPTDGGSGGGGSGAGTDPGYVTGQWYLGVNFSGANATGAALTTGTAYCTAQKLMNPVSSGGTGTIGSLALRIPTVGTSTITMALYQDGVVGGVHRPKTLLGYTAQVANTSVTTLTGALNVGVSVPSSLIWTCATQGDSTGKVSLMSLGSDIGYAGNSSATSIVTNTGYGVTFPVTYGASASATWPADNSAATFSESTNVTPLVMFQFSSIP